MSNFTSITPTIIISKSFGIFYIKYSLWGDFEDTFSLKKEKSFESLIENPQPILSQTLGSCFLAYHNWRLINKNGAPLNKDSLDLVCSSFNFKDSLSLDFEKNVKLPPFEFYVGYKVCKIKDLSKTFSVSKKYLADQVRFGKFLDESLNPYYGIRYNLTPINS